MENEEMPGQEEEIEKRGRRRILERQEASVCATIAHTLLVLE